MSYKIKEITDYIEKIAPLCAAESYDNTGLIIDTGINKAEKIYICLDIKEGTVEEAVKEKADLIISHHPILFKSINRLSVNEREGRIISELIKNNISLYSAHTNFDSAEKGLNYYIAKKLGIKKLHNFKKAGNEEYFKLVVFVPYKNSEDVRNAMSIAGAGHIGNYSDCFFETEGKGTFKPGAGTKPFIGEENGAIETVKEKRLETVVMLDDLHAVIGAMKKAHPYEEVAYDVYSVKTDHYKSSMGRFGEIERTEAKEYIESAMKTLGIKNGRVIGSTDKNIKKVLISSGSFSPDFKSLKTHKIDFVLTGEVKYHDALLLSDMGIVTLETGHFSSEIIFTEYMEKLLKEKFKDLKTVRSSEKDIYKYI
jgi:dinuclear metal center YbgI/SA1388 family protein